MIFSLAGAVAGCSQHSKVGMKPLTASQKSFVQIKALHERGKSREIVRKAQDYLSAFPDEDLARPVRYYLALHTERLGDKDMARRRYEEIVKLYPKTRWSQLARSNLKTMNRRES